ncbi:MAG: hypothetical protein ACREFJ_09045, partial [Acetobacteraceae bacterium]
MIHAKITLLALAAAAAAFVLAPPAQASVISYDFTVTITSGPLPSGTVENGSFSYDSSSIVPNGSNSATGLLTALAFTLNGITYNASTANTGFLAFKVGDLVNFSFGNQCFAGGCGADATANSWYASPGGDGFAYGVSGGSS